MLNWLGADRARQLAALHSGSPSRLPAPFIGYYLHNSNDSKAARIDWPDGFASAAEPPQADNNGGRLCWPTCGGQCRGPPQLSQARRGSKCNGFNVGRRRFPALIAHSTECLQYCLFTAREPLCKPLRGLASLFILAGSLRAGRETCRRARRLMAARPS